MAAIAVESPAAVGSAAQTLEGYDAAGRAAAGYFFLFGQEKVTKKKAAPEPPTPPALLAPAGREPNSPGA